MFIRVRRTEDRQGWRGYLKKVEFVQTEVGTIPIGVYARHYKRGIGCYYMAMVSERTPRGPRNRAIVCWADIPTLRGAIDHYTAKLAEMKRDAENLAERVDAEQQRNAGHEYTRRYPVWQLHRRKLTSIQTTARKLAKLQEVHAVLGDWTDPSIPDLHCDATTRELERVSQDTQAALMHNRTVYESRAALQQEVDDKKAQRHEHAGLSGFWR